MAEPSEISEAIADAAADGTQSVTADGMTVSEHSLADRLKALEKLSQDQGASKPHRGLRFTKLIPPGAS